MVLSRDPALLRLPLLPKHQVSKKQALRDRRKKKNKVDMMGNKVGKKEMP